jgi:DNA-binding CsgD family transcriptional regulator
VAAPNRAALTYADAVVAGRSGRAGAAVDLSAQADAAVSAMPWWNRLLRTIALECAVRDGWGDPVPALRADLAAHEGTGDSSLARICRDLLRTAGAPTRRGRGETSVSPALRSHGITAREADVLGLVVERQSNAEIAERLFLSRRTVESHVARLLAKSSTSGREELRAWAARVTESPEPPGRR